MPRRSGGSAPRARRSPSPPPRREMHTQPARSSAAPPPAHQQQGRGGMMSGLGATVMQGMALGTGSAMAHRAVDAVLGSRHPEPQAATEAADIMVREQLPCADQAKQFSDCMMYTNGDMGSCQKYFEAMQSCRVGGQQMSYQ